MVNGCAVSLPGLLLVHCVTLGLWARASVYPPQGSQFPTLSSPFSRSHFLFHLRGLAAALILPCLPLLAYWPQCAFVRVVLRFSTAIIVSFSVVLFLYRPTPGQILFSPYSLGLRTHLRAGHP